MDHETLATAMNADALVVRFDRTARRNAFNMAMLGELTQVLRDTRPEARSVILTGGPECFSAGRDLKEAAQMGSSEAAVEAFEGLAAAIEGHALPVIAAIEGPCLTGGLELALCCDIRIAGKGSTFGITSARLGTLPGFGATQRLPRLVGIPRTLEILFSADTIPAESALEYGLLHRLVGQGEALATSLELAELYARRAPLSLAGLKAAVRQGMEMPLEDGLRLERRLGWRLRGTKDREEGVKAFIEKRPPRFTGT